MSLLGMPARRPAVRGVYFMPHELYDETDYSDHPILVVALDLARREAHVVTRTTKMHARTHKCAAHAGGLIDGLDLAGWWRLHKVHKVPWTNFDDPDVELLGMLDDVTWQLVQNTIDRKEGH